MYTTHLKTLIKRRTWNSFWKKIGRLWFCVDGKWISRSLRLVASSSERSFLRSTVAGTSLLQFFYLSESFPVGLSPVAFVTRFFERTHVIVIELHLQLISWPLFDTFAEFHSSSCYNKRDEEMSSLKCQKNIC